MAMVAVLAVILVVCIWKLRENSKKVRDFRLGIQKDSESDTEFTMSDSLKRKIEEYQKKNKEAQKQSS